MKRVIKIAFVLLILVLPVLPVYSARIEPPGEYVIREHTCPEIVQTAWENVDRVCEGAGRNEACYGHILLDAQPQPGVERFEFDEEGNVVEVSDLRSLRLSTMDLLNGYWGVALLRIQANLPAAAIEDNVSLLLFGDVEIENTGGNMPTVEVINASNFDTINIRYSPSTSAAVLGALAQDEIMLATGRWTDSWVRVELPDRAIPGWVYAPLISAVDGDLDSLAEVEVTSTYYGPMQAFYFESGTNDAACPEAPNSGILIQTPEGVAEVTLLINEVDIQLGSTVYFQATSDTEMTVSTLEGHATVTVGDETQTAVAGTQVTIPMANGVAAGPPSRPRPYDMDSLKGLPVTHIGRPVTITEPLTEEEIETALENLPSNDSSVENPSTGAPPPGLGEVYPPGQSDDPNPGQGGTPPGQAKKE